MVGRRLAIGGCRSDLRRSARERARGVDANPLPDPGTRLAADSQLWNFGDALASVELYR